MLLSVSVLARPASSPASKDKSVKLGEYVVYNGNVNAAGKPEGKGTLEVTVTRNGEAIGKDVVKGTFAPDNDYIQDAEVTFASGWKFKGEMVCSLRSDNSFIEYGLQNGYIMILDPVTEFKFAGIEYARGWDVFTDEDIIKFLPVLSADKTQKNIVTIQRQLPSQDVTVTIPEFTTYLNYAFFNWVTDAKETPEDVKSQAKYWFDELENPKFNPKASYLPQVLIKPLSMKCFNSQPGSYYVKVNMKISNVDNAWWASREICPVPLHEYWKPEITNFAVTFQDGTVIEPYNNPAQSNEVKALTVKIPGRDTDEFTYVPVIPKCSEGHILHMKVKRDGMDFDMKGTTCDERPQISYKNSNGDSYEGTGGFGQPGWQNEHMSWIFKTFYLPSTIDTQAWNSRFGAYTGKWKRASGRIEEWKGGSNITAEKKQADADDKALTKLLQPYYKKYGKKNVDIFMKQSLGFIQVGMSFNMINELFNNKNSTIRRVARHDDENAPYMLLQTRNATYAEVLSYGRGVKFYAITYRDRNMNKRVVYRFYVRNGKVVGIGR